MHKLFIREPFNDIPGPSTLGTTYKIIPLKMRTLVSCLVNSFALFVIPVPKGTYCWQRRESFF